MIPRSVLIINEAQNPLLAALCSGQYAPITHAIEVMVKCMRSVSIHLNVDIRQPVLLDLSNSALMRSGNRTRVLGIIARWWTLASHRQTYSRPAELLFTPNKNRGKLTIFHCGGCMPREADLETEAAA